MHLFILYVKCMHNPVFLWHVVNTSNRPFNASTPIKATCIFI